jgi:dihydrofolate reductase
MVNIIFAVDQNNNFCSSDRISLPWKRVSEDMKWFKDRTTLGDGKNAVIMGKNTFASMCHTPLKDRINIIVSKTMSTQGIFPDNIIVANRLNSAINKAKEAGCKNIFVIGGITLIEESFRHPDLEQIFITTINNEYDSKDYVKFNYSLPDNMYLRDIINLGNKIGRAHV